jgi:hypothetical protein
VRSVASTAKAIDPNTFPEVQLMKSGFRQKLRSGESSALAVSALGFVADLLACLGIVGVVAYAVSQRTREIGIRMALGARPAHILAVVLRQFSRPVAAGLLVGVGGAAALSGLLRRPALWPQQFRSGRLSGRNRALCAYGAGCRPVACPSRAARGSDARSVTSSL